MRAIELETEIPADGKLPEEFRPAFGHRARVIVLLADVEDNAPPETDDSARLMRLAGTIDWPIEDPVAWQKSERDDWDSR